MSQDLSQVTSTGASGASNGPASNIGGSVSLNAIPPARRRFGFGAATLAVVLAGVAIAGGLYVADPSIFGTAAIEDVNAEQPAPVSDEANTAVANLATAEANNDTPPVNAEAPVTNVPTQSVAKSAETTRSSRAQAAKPPPNDLNDTNEPDVDVEMDDPAFPKQVVITERRRDGSVKVTRFNPNTQQPGFEFNPFPNGFDHQRLTPEQREKIREAIRKIPKPPITKAPPVQP
jgi:hypothetical protein